MQAFVRICSLHVMFDPCMPQMFAACFYNAHLPGWPHAVCLYRHGEVLFTAQAKFVVEAANGPTTPGGDAVLRERGIEVLPDIYTNGGAPPLSLC